jgi:hypothetical protein
MNILGIICWFSLWGGENKDIHAFQPVSGGSPVLLNGGVHELNSSQASIWPEIFLKIFIRYYY